MFCNNCGLDKKDYLFCPSCGTGSAPRGGINPAPPQQQVVNYAPPPRSARQPTNGLAIASLVVSLTCCGGVLGIIFGHIALGQIKRTGEEGRGLALAGLIIGYVILALIVVYFFVVYGLLGLAASQDY